jgi:hypothetical protein
MDYAALLHALDKASLFDLWRLKTFIARSLEDPRKNEAIRARLRVDQSIHYFDARENREISGRIVAVNRSRALVRHDHDQKLWNIPFYMINLQGTDVDLHHTRDHSKVRRDSLKVGDSIGYISRSQREVYGVITKLNRKTATVKTTDGVQWNVSYGLLFYVVDAQDSSPQVLLNGCVVTAESGVEEYHSPADANSVPG